MSDDDLTPEEAAMLRQLITDLGTIDALMTVVQQTCLRYPERSVRVPRAYWSELLDVTADAVIAWQALRASPGGALFDPRVIHPEEGDDAE